jgi:glycosyltransferase EpsE
MSMQQQIKPRVSVITLLYHRHVFLRRAVESLRRQTVQDWELILVQDGEDPEVAKAAEEVANLDCRIRYFRRDRKGSIGEAANFAIRRSHGDLIAILDDDDEWAVDEKLAIQISRFEEDNQLVACGGAVITVDANGRELLRYQKPLDDKECRRIALVGNPIANSSAMFRRAAFESVGGYDTVNISDFQDWEFWLKMGSIGRLSNVSEYLVRYTVWENSSSARRHRSNAKSALRIVLRHRSGYPGAYKGILLAVVYFAYSYSPGIIRSRAMRWLSLAKKRLFADRTPTKV